jgi:tetratricopeptide (TPR) repeat protein
MALSMVGVVLVAGGALVLKSALWRAPEPPVPADLGSTDRAFAEAAQRAIERVRQQPREHERWLTLGMVYEANQMMSLAEECYATSEALGGSARATYHLAVLRSRLGDIPGAVEAMRRTIAADDSHGPAHWRLGFWLLDQNELEGAESAFREAMSHRSGPFDLAGEIGLARLSMQRGELDRAQAILGPIAARPSPYAPYASHLLGTTLARKGQFEEARAALARGRASEPIFPDPLYEQISAHRTDSEWLVLRAKGLVSRGDFAPAIALLEEALHDRPGDAFVLNNLAVAYVGARRFAEATALLERVLEASPGSYQGHYNAALAAHAQASLADEAQAAALRASALEHLDESLRLNPAFGGALGMKADMLHDAGLDAEALELYFQGLATEPTSAMWWRGAALSAAAIGEHEQALACIAQLEALRPGDPQITQLTQLTQLTQEVELMRTPTHGESNALMPNRTRAEEP